MSQLERKFLLKDNEFEWTEIKDKIYNGKILYMSQIKDSYALKDFILSILEKKLKSKNIQEFEKTISPEKFHKKISKIKEELSSNNEIKKLVTKLLENFFFESKTTYVDDLRLRCVTSYLHTIEKAKPAFAIHRDTWYANPETQINYWIPLFPVTEKNTFSFYPKYFSKPIQNNSSLFDIEEWNSLGGFQASPEKEKIRIFPEANNVLPINGELKISMQAGELLLFSASHLHATRPNQTDLTRFSIDFRTIDTTDIYGAPNLDNRSRGSIINNMWKLSDYK